MGNPCAERRDRETGVVGAVEHETGLICGQVKVADKSNEIPAARKLLRSMQLSGRIVTADAMHTQVETTQLILDKGGDYLMVVKGNQKTILDDLKAIDWNDQEVGKSETVEKTHGRIDTRSCLVVELDKTWDGYVELPGRRQAFRAHTSETQKGKDRRDNFGDSLRSNFHPAVARRACRDPRHRSPSLGNREPACSRHDLR